MLWLWLKKTKNMDNFETNFHRMFKVLLSIIAIVFAMMMTGIIFAIVLFSKGCTAINDHGLKGVVEQVWNGPTNSTNTP